MLIAFLQRILESNEVLAAVITALLLLIGWYLTPRGKITWGVSHQQNFLLPPAQPQQTSAESAQTPSNPPLPIRVFTQDVRVENTGRARIDAVEVILNYAPFHYEVWPTHQFQISATPGNRSHFVMTFANLAAKEWLVISLFSINQEIPLVTNVRWSGGVGKQVPIAPLRVWPKWVRATFWTFLLLGLFALAYFGVRLFQFVYSLTI
jgi:hypothetical protein